MVESEPNIITTTTTNLLCLDGGGVRGLSTLLILQCLMLLIEEEVAASLPGQPRPKLLPSDVFDVVIGTSTGGLIALMLVKLGMDIDACIDAYKKLSEAIFSQWHKLSLLTFGFGRIKKFSGKRFREVIVKEVLEKYLPHLDNAGDFCMEDEHKFPHLECTVVCRQLDDDGVWCEEPVLLCSHKCRQHHGSKNGEYEKVKVADAARATTAAPTYFSPVTLLGKILVDGGYGYTNNPSEVAWLHYIVDPNRQHAITQLVNIGTGSEPSSERLKRKAVDNTARKESHKSPSWWRDIRNTKQNTLRLLTFAEGPANVMMTTARGMPGLRFKRFSADENGIHKINLSDYKKMLEIETATHNYLKRRDVRDDLLKTAKELAKTYLDRRQPQQTQQPPQPPAPAPSPQEIRRQVLVPIETVPQVRLPRSSRTWPLEARPIAFNPLPTPNFLPGVSPMPMPMPIHKPLVVGAAA